MKTGPPFFVPNATVEEQEEVYLAFARMAGQSTPPLPEKRIYSIDYYHNGVNWTATVGETLKGIEWPKEKKRSSLSPPSQPRPIHRGDPATVLAIFPGDPYMVVTNHRIAGNVRSRWENPFMAGRPSSVTYFRLGE